MVVFSAVEHGNGCSWVCARAGEALAAHGDGTVCLVDANPHSPMLHQYFGVNCSSSTCRRHIAAGTRSQPCAADTRQQSLVAVAQAALPSDAIGVTNRQHLKQCIAELRAKFRDVLVDTPPVNECADSMAFGQMADGVVLVLEAHSTRRDSARRAKATLEAAHVKLLGVVLNKRTFPIPRALYRKL